MEYLIISLVSTLVIALTSKAPAEQPPPTIIVNVDRSGKVQQVSEADLEALDAEYIARGNAIAAEQLKQKQGASK